MCKQIIIYDFIIHRRSSGFHHCQCHSWRCIIFILQYNYNNILVSLVLYKISSFTKLPHALFPNSLVNLFYLLHWKQYTILFLLSYLITRNKTSVFTTNKRTGRISIYPPNFKEWFLILFEDLVRNSSLQWNLQCFFFKLLHKKSVGIEQIG